MFIEQEHAQIPGISDEKSSLEKAGITLGITLLIFVTSQMYVQEIIKELLPSGQNNISHNQHKKRDKKIVHWESSGQLESLDLNCKQHCTSYAHN